MSVTLEALKIAQRYMPSVDEVNDLTFGCQQYDNPEQIIIEIDLVDKEISRLESKSHNT